jgi:Protein of unknown function (DUF2971)
MVDEKLFYRYQSLKVEKDDKGNDIIYTIQNLTNNANNQLYFSSPSKFNDPFDFRAYCFSIDEEEDLIESIIRIEHIDRIQAKTQIQSKIDHGIYEIRDDLIYFEYSDRCRDDKLKVCCFSGRDESILMWSHYADNHQGICIRFRSLLDCLNFDEDEYYLELSIDNQVYNRFEVPFFKVKYTSDPPEPFNVSDLKENSYFNLNKDRFFDAVLNKFSDWAYEDEHRMIIGYRQGVFTSETDFDKGMVKYPKEDLEGIVFGLRISYENAKLAYETVKKNYLDKGITVNFYEAKEVPRKYAVGIIPIYDVEKYIDSLRE